MSNEAPLRKELCDLMKIEFPGCVVQRFEDLFTAGYPDIANTYRKKTVWLETKHAAPTLNVTTLQLTRGYQLQLQGYCYFIIYSDRKKTGPRTVIALPSEISEDHKSWTTPDVRMCAGFDHTFVTNFLKGVFHDSQ